MVHFKTVLLCALTSSEVASRPIPAPGSNATFPNSCDDKSGGDWPEFHDHSALMKDTQWSKYFELVYGAVPTFGYPICVSGFHVLYSNALNASGISKTVVDRPRELGDYYESSEFTGVPVRMIYHGVGPFQGFGSNQWVEALHCKAEKETVGAWYYYGPGSGVWIYSGNTKTYQTRNESWKEILGVDDCGSDFQCGGELFSTAYSKFGWDTIQYLAEGGGGGGGSHNHTNRTDYNKTDQNSTRPIMKPGDRFMFIHTTGVGAHTCGAKNSVWKAGWAGQSECDCDQTLSCQNCQGYSSADKCDDCDYSSRRRSSFGRRRSSTTVVTTTAIPYFNGAGIVVT